MKMYLSGKVSGLSKEEYERNFNLAADLVSAAGHEPVNPIKVVLDNCEGVEVCGGEGEIHHWTCYMRHDLRDMLLCDAIVVLPNWTDSSGARLEITVADELSMKMYAVSGDWSEICPWRHCDV
jgi:hypothetical protein